MMDVTRSDHLDTCANGNASLGVKFLAQPRTKQPDAVKDAFATRLPCEIPLSPLQ